MRCPGNGIVLGQQSEAPRRQVHYFCRNSERGFHQYRDRRRRLSRGPKNMRRAKSVHAGTGGFSPSSHNRFSSRGWRYTDGSIREPSKRFLVVKMDGSVVRMNTKGVVIFGGLVSSQRKSMLFREARVSDDVRPISSDDLSHSSSDRPF